MTDLADRTDDWDGFGVLIGAMVGFPAAVATALGAAGGGRIRRRDPSARGFAVASGLLLLLPLLLPGAFVIALPLAVLGGALLVVTLMPGPGAATGQSTATTSEPSAHEDCAER